MTIAVHEVPSADLFTLATIPTPKPELPTITPGSPDLARRIIAASIRITTPTPTMIHTTPQPRSARRHIALEGVSP